MDTLRVRVYDVRFGDAILITVPDEDENGAATTRHILIDVGNALTGAGGQDQVFRPVLEDVRSELAGRPLDLYVMTHEHMDHVQGLLYASDKLGIDLQVSHAWLTASAHPRYYETHPDAKKKLDLAHDLYDEIGRFLAASPAGVPEAVRIIMANNDYRSTGKCVDYLRTLPANPTTYVHRESDLAGTNPFRRATLSVWAPEEDTADYYGSFQPHAVLVAPAADTATPVPVTPTPPAGVDASAFYNLVDRRRRGWMDNLLAIDKAANNTSVVFSLDWGGWTLLFTGDAEERSWLTMEREGVLRAVDLLKVSHHGSHNGTPEQDILDVVLPMPAPADSRFAVVSTFPGTYDNVPDDPTLSELAARCQLKSTLDIQPGEHFIDITLAAR